MKRHDDFWIAFYFALVKDLKSYKSLVYLIKKISKIKSIILMSE
jgi:hypothetical protein